MKSLSNLSIQGSERDTHVTAKCGTERDAFPQIHLI